MKKYIFFLLLAFGFMINPFETKAQHQNTGNWEMGHNINDTPYYAITLAGFSIDLDNSNNNRNCHLLIKVDYVDGFTLVVLDRKGNMLPLGIASVTISRAGENDFINIDQMVGEYGYIIKNTNSFTKLSNALCNGNCTIFVAPKYGTVSYGFKIMNETRGFENAVINLMEYYNRI